MSAQHSHCHGCNGHFWMQPSSQNRQHWVCPKCHFENAKIHECTERVDKQGDRYLTCEDCHEIPKGCFGGVREQGRV